MHIHHYYLIRSLKSTSTITSLVTKLNQKTHLTFVTQSYHILATFCTILKKKEIQNFAKNVVKKTLTLSYFLTHLKLKISFHMMTQFLIIKSFLVYKYTCASCSSSYIAKTCHHFKTRIEKHIKKENNSHIFKHQCSTTTCFDSYNYLSYK